MGDRRRWGVAGTIGAGVSLAVGELLAGLFTGVPSPLSAVGRWVVEGAPAWLEDLAIATFGTADKLALAIGTIVIVVVIGWFVGIAGLRRRPLIPAVFVGFGLLGIVAGLGEPGARAIAVTAASLVAMASGLAVLFALAAFAQADDPTDGMANDAGRRRFIGVATAAGVGAVAVGLVGRRLLTRSPDLPAVRIPTGGTPVATAHELGIPGLTPIVVPNADFYRIDTALVVPRVDPASWELRIHGLVDRPFTIGYDDLLSMEMIDAPVTIACVSNEVGGRLVGNAVWTGVRLSEVLERAGVQSGAGQVVGRSVDRFTAGFPVEAALDGRNPLIAVAMNGDPLPAKHGFPARLIVPGLYGYVSATKWLAEIEITTWDGFDGYWVPRGWAKEGPIKTQSRIDLPTSRVPAGQVDMAGVAFSPLHGIAAVEVAVDGGDWQPARLSVPMSTQAWVQWHAVVTLDPGVHGLAVRAIDGSGAVQTAERRPPRPDGATGHHTIRVTAG